MTHDELAASIAAALEQPGSSLYELDGQRRGIEVSVRIRRTSDLSNWLVKAKVPAPALLLTVRARRAGERGAIESGAITEVLTGDAAFDREWLVEGAPAAATREAVDRSVREAVVAAARVTLGVDQGSVAAGANEIDFGADDVGATIELVVRTCERLAAMKREGTSEGGAESSRARPGPSRSAWSWSASSSSSRSVAA
jgi:hypothetical protein